LGKNEPIDNHSTANPEQLYVELWVSLASLLRSYTAVHGLNGKRQATVELGEERITVRCGEAWLDLQRDGAKVNRQREDGRKDILEFTEAGLLKSRDPRSQNRDRGHPCEEEMDMAAERWARELMQ
jgi:hypothetical protein